MDIEQLSEVKRVVADAVSPEGCVVLNADDPRVLEVRYESLITEPEHPLGRLFEKLGEAWEPQVLKFFEVESESRNVAHFPQNPEVRQPIFSTSLGRWKKGLSVEEQAVFEDSEAGALLDELGYR